MGIDFKWDVTISSDIKTYKKISECFKIIDELSENNLQAKKSFLNFDFSASSLVSFFTIVGERIRFSKTVICGNKLKC